MATLQSSSPHFAQSYQLAGEAVFRANVILALARSIEPQNLMANTSRVVESYDYVAGMGYLESACGVSFHNQNSDPKAAVFQTLGFTYPSLPSPEGYALLCGLLQCNHTGSTTQPLTGTLRPLTEQSPRESRWSNSTSEATLPPEAQSENNKAKYTSILYEIGQAKGKKVDRTALELASDPPQFKVTIRFGTLRASGTGRQKKIAGHLAAEKICHQLGIRV